MVLTKPWLTDVVPADAGTLPAVDVATVPVGHETAATSALNRVRGLTGLGEEGHRDTRRHEEEEFQGSAAKHADLRKSTVYHVRLYLESHAVQ